MCVCTRMHTCACMCACIVHEVSEEVIRSLRIVLTSGHGPPNMGAETWTWSLWKSSTGPWLLSHLSRRSIMNLTGLLAEIFPNGSVLRKSGTTVGRELSEKSHTREPGLLLNTMVSLSSPPCCFITLFFFSPVPGSFASYTTGCSRDAASSRKPLVISFRVGWELPKEPCPFPIIGALTSLCHNCLWIP